jgi:hypothetical protein
MAQERDQTVKIYLLYKAKKDQLEKKDQPLKDQPEKKDQPPVKKDQPQVKKDQPQVKKDKPQVKKLLLYLVKKFKILQVRKKYLQS